MGTIDVYLGNKYHTLITIKYHSREDIVHCPDAAGLHRPVYIAVLMDMHTVTLHAYTNRLMMCIYSCFRVSSPFCTLHTACNHMHSRDYSMELRSLTC